MLSNFDDDFFLSRLRAGEEQAFAQLVHQQRGRLLGVCRRILRSEEDAIDCLQDVFVAVLRGLPGFQGDARLTTWLHRVAVNTALMRLRSKRRKREELHGNEAALSSSATQAFQWLPLDPESEAIREHEARVVRACVERLPAHHRAVVILRDFEGLGTAEAAASLGTNPDALKMRLYRAHEALRALLSHEMGEPGRLPSIRELRPVPPVDKYAFPDVAVA